MDVGPDDNQTRMWFVGEFLEVTEPERLVHTESMSDEYGNVVSPGAAGWTAALDALAQHLDQQPA